MFSGIWAAPAPGGLSEHSGTASERTGNRHVMLGRYHICRRPEEHLARGTYTPQGFLIFLKNKDAAVLKWIRLLLWTKKHDTRNNK